MRDAYTTLHANLRGGNLSKPGFEASDQGWGEADHAPFRGKLTSGQPAVYPVGVLPLPLARSLQGAAATRFSRVETLSLLGNGGHSARCSAASASAGGGASQHEAYAALDSVLALCCQACRRGRHSDEEDGA